MPPFRALAAAALMLCGGCSIAEDAAVPPVAATITAPCAETPPTPIEARPPSLAATTSAWFGQGDLWVGLPDYAPAEQGDALVLRFPFVTLTQGRPTAGRGAPIVTAARIDAPGEAPGQVGTFARAYGTDELSFWPASVAFPDAGCWTVTGLLGTDTVQFTVDVERP